MSMTHRPISDDEHEAEMAQLSEMFGKRIHPDLVVAAAFDHCDRHQRPLPQWLVGPGAKLICKLLNDKSPKPAKNATPSALYVKDMRNWIRWDLMDEITGARRLIRKEIKNLKSMAISKRRTARHRAVLDDQHANLRLAGPGWSHALERVSVRLKGTFARGGEQTIKKSYMEVDNATGELGLRYHRFSRSFLDRVGIDIDLKISGK